MAIKPACNLRNSNPSQLFSQIGRMSTSLAGRANTAGHRMGRLVRTARAGKRSKIEWRLKDSGRDAGELCPGASTIVQREIVCVCVCVGEGVYVCVCLCVCVCVCVSSTTETDRVKDREVRYSYK